MNQYHKHPTALVESEKIGNRSRVRAFARILPGASIGADCEIGDHVLVENQVVMGDRVTVRHGVHLCDGVTLEDDVFIGPNATFTNNPLFARRGDAASGLATLVQRGASIGANATILPGLVVGQNAMVCAGAVVTRSVPAHAVVVGNPAVIENYVDTQARPTGVINPSVGSRGDLPVFSKVPRVRAHRLPIITDLRGSISVGELDKGLPFPPKRYFTVFNVPTREVRGEHAHRICHQFLVCVRGQINLVVDDGRDREELIMDSPGVGVHVPPMVWAVQYRYSPDAVLLVLASETYDPNDYIRDYEEFIRLRQAHVGD